MGYLSKEIFKLHFAEKKTSNILIRIYNSQVYNNPYADNRLKNIVPEKYFYAPSKGGNIQMVIGAIESLPSVTIGHASILKASLYNDIDKFMPLTLQYMVWLYEKGPKVINNNLIKQVSELYHFQNTTRYYLAPCNKIIRALVVNKGCFSFLSYR